MKNKEISKWYVYITGILVIPVTIFVTVWFGHGKAGAANDQVRPDRLSQSQIEEKLKTVTPPNVKINSVEYLDYLGLYEVITPQFTFYMSQDGKYIIMGQVFETATRRNVTQEHVDSKRRVDLSALPPGDAIRVGKGAHKLVVFSDLTCPHCRMLHQELKKLNDTEIYIYLINLYANNTDNVKRTASVICSANPGETLDKLWSVTQGQPPKVDMPSPTQACMDSIARNDKYARSQGVYATPTMVLADGRILTGYRKVDEIKRYLMETGGK